MDFIAMIPGFHCLMHFLLTRKEKETEVKQLYQVSHIKHIPGLVFYSANSHI